ncbi:response regulator transcription factor [Paenibacillus oenotherae]|uniref:Response regulator transcription factor n=1 Tax=Paenibacillus oenotherae TaxID=1435645 RepID=A0ABS7D8G5_9BACL|nr:response regulator transcription factor [Paenibacillus oenotherae]MBW7475866.1 response regulator transcription factor [Paenibacillus oenotherae]
MKNVLIIEDEKPLARFLELELAHEGYKVETCHEGLEGLHKALLFDYDFILLDLMLPKMSGLEVCRKVRAAKTTPIIMITARNAVIDRVVGLDLGADDYLTKPFAIEELLARIRSLNRRMAPAAQPASPRYTVGDLTLEPDSHRVQRANQTISLSHREYELLKYLMEHQNTAIPRNQLLNEVWGYDFDGGTNVVDVYIRYLRAKLDDPHAIKLIHTIRGFGYVIRNP